MNAQPPLSLIDLFRGLEEHHFVVMKTLPEPDPKPGSDIDLLCQDAIMLGRAFVRNARPLIALGYEIRISSLPETDQTHIDLMLDDAIQLRIDLHEGLGCYPGLTVRETFARGVIDRKQNASIKTPLGDLHLPIPEPIDNLVLRYLEYHAFFDARPDKVKHAQAIAEQTTHDPALQQAFFDRLSQAMANRPARPFLKYCDFNAKRQLTWLYWSLRDKTAWRITWLKQAVFLAISQPRIFIRKLAGKLIPSINNHSAYCKKAH